jgi:phosphatidylglycerophosphate synthase
MLRPSVLVSSRQMRIFAMRLYENIADGRRVAQPTGEDWTSRQYRAVSIFLSVPLARTGVSANLITIAWVVLGVLGAVALGCPHYWVRVGGACLLQFSELLDFVDGEVARLNRQTSKVGVFLDGVGHDVIQRSLFLPLGYEVFRATNNVAYLFLAFSAGVFVSSYQMAPFFAEYAGLEGLAGDQGSTWRTRYTSSLRKVVKPMFFLMKQTKNLILVAAVFDRLSWILLYYAIAAPMLFLWRVLRLSQRLGRGR